ncbi:DUF6744 family protein [Paenibacillus sp. Leaf72]|uniref:DUF6744 family protein n=1 Tax=Paenibacillus sp. Leaf72 TaxID=1736234 RepID=UPI0006F71076|nr:DUF6744 family protein [Paenibacillus sp. Leaf72]KQN96865.1 hypothetical protein ASF12_22615 [Paenibacillus sp. Leaf72]
MRAGLRGEFTAVGMEDKGTVEVVGYLCWYSIGMKLIARNLLQEYVNLSGVAEKYMPNKIRIIDAYRRATKAIECKRPLETGKGSITYLVKEVSSTRETVQRNIVKEVIDSNDNSEPLKYDTKEAIITLNRVHDHRLQTSVINEEVRPLVERVTELFELFKTTHDDNAIRSMCVDIIRHMSPVLVKASGGVYFIPIKYEKELRAFRELVNLIEQSKAEIIPLIKTNDTIDMVRKATLKQVNESHERLKAAYNDESISASDITAVVENSNLAFRVIDDYKDLLKSDLSDVESSYHDMERMLRAVAARKKDHKPKENATRQMRLFE